MQFLTSIAFAVLTALSAVDAAAAIEGYVRTETVDYNGHAGVRFITYSRSRAKAALFKFDLTKGYRIRVWHGDTNASGAKRSALGAMAENLRTETGVVPIAGINGDYFRTDADEARPTGLVVSDSLLVHGGWSAGRSTDYCYLAELGDHNLYHGRLDCAAGYPGGDPSRSWQLGASGRKVRNAVRTNYQNYPVKGGVINPVGGGSSPDGYDFSTTIGNYQSRTAYWRTLVGIGTNATGVATNLVLFTSDPGGIILADFPDVDAYRMMIDEGCNEVGELDGGGSAQMWAQAAAGMMFGGPATAHGGYVLSPRDTAPIRPVANGIFVLPPPAKPDAFAVNGVNTYPTLEEARLAATHVTHDTVEETGTDRPRRGVCVEGRGIVWDPYVVFGAQTQDITNFFRQGSVSVEVKEQVACLDGTTLRLSVTNEAGGAVAAVDRTLSGPGVYDFSLPDDVICDALAGGSFFLSYAFSIPDIADDGTVPVVPALSGSAGLAAGGVWFVGDAASDVTTGGAWVRRPSTDPAAVSRSGEDALFEANDAKSGVVRIEMTVAASNGFDAEVLDALLETCVSKGVQASIVTVEEGNGLVLCGLVGTKDGVAWTRLHGVDFTAGTTCRVVSELDYGGTSPRVSYLVANGPDAALVRLHDAEGNVWHGAAVRDAVELAGAVGAVGDACLSSVKGFTAEKPPEYGLDCIQADGVDDYIDLGVVGSDGLRMEAELEWIAVPGSSVFCGSSRDAADGRFWLYGRDGTQQLAGYLGDVATIDGASYPVAVGRRCRIVTTLDAGSQDISCIMRDTETAYGSCSGSVAGPNDTRLPLYLFADDADGAATSFAAVKCYSFKLFRKDTSGRCAVPVRDLVPVMDPNRGGAPAFYDLVSGTYLRSGGNGPLGGGNAFPLVPKRVKGLVIIVR